PAPAAGPEAPAEAAAAPAAVAADAEPAQAAAHPRAQHGLDVAPPDNQAGDRAALPAAGSAAAAPGVPPGNPRTPRPVGADPPLLLARRPDPASGAAEASLPSVGRPLSGPTRQRQPADSGSAQNARSEETDQEAPASAPAHEADLVTDVPATDLRGLGLK